MQHEHKSSDDPGEVKYFRSDQDHFPDQTGRIERKVDARPRQRKYDRRHRYQRQQVKDAESDRFLLGCDVG